jgi:hypothetical protein
MDQTTALLSTTTGGTVVGVLLLLYKSVNGKRLRSNCCGRKMEMDFKVDDVPPSPDFVVQNPTKQINVVVKQDGRECGNAEKD